MVCQFELYSFVMLFALKKYIFEILKCAKYAGCCPSEIKIALTDLVMIQVVEKPQNFCQT